jgi:hypothetical protein
MRRCGRPRHVRVGRDAKGLSCASEIDANGGKSRTRTSGGVLRHGLLERRFSGFLPPKSSPAARHPQNAYYGMYEYY